MSETPAPPPPGPARQELLNTIGSWVLSVLRTEPGWDRMVVDLKVQGGRVHLRVREQRGDEVVPAALEARVDVALLDVDEAVFDVVEQIPRGRVSTYGAIGRLVGVGPRRVARALSSGGGAVPWFRVARADGTAAVVGSGLRGRRTGGAERPDVKRCPSMQP